VILTRKQEPRVLVLSQVDRGQLTVGQERREDLIVDGVGMEQVQQHLSLCPRRVLPHPTIPGDAAIRLRRPRVTQSLNGYHDKVTVHQQKPLLPEYLLSPATCDGRGFVG
jgi:hypothetical protein